jgi:hypothetical protein
MSDISIKITNFSGRTIEIDENSTITENSKIKELIKAYAEKNVINEEGVLDEFNLQLVMDAQILDDNRKLNEVLPVDVLQGKVTLSAVIRSLGIAKCLRPINKLDSLYFREEKLVKLERILREETNEEDPSI